MIRLHRRAGKSTITAANDWPPPLLTETWSFQTTQRTNPEISTTPGTRFRTRASLHVGGRPAQSVREESTSEEDDRGLKIQRHRVIVSDGSTPKRCLY